MSRRALTLAAFAAILIALAPHARAQEGDPAAPSLEEQVRQLRAELDDMKAQKGGSAESGSEEGGEGGGTSVTAEDHGEGFLKTFGRNVTVTWKDGFRLNYLDEDESDPKKKVLHDLRFLGRAQLDYRLSLDDDAPNDSSVRDDNEADTGSFFFRRLRLGMQGSFYHGLFEWKVEIDFAPDGEHAVKDAYINVAPMEILQVEAGNFKIPMMFEQLVSSRFINFIERPMAEDVYQIDRDLGVMLHGEHELFSYALGVVNGDGSNTKDSNEQKDIVGRLELTPLAGGEGFAKGLVLASAFTTGHQRNFSPNYETRAGDLEWLEEPDSQHGNRTRVSAELALTDSPLRIQLEYLYMRVADMEVDGTGVFQDVSHHTFYADVLYMLTGETYKRSKAVRPDAPFLIDGGFGAFQLGVRYERMYVESSYARKVRASQGGFGTDTVDSITVGLNWYLNEWVRFRVNYQRVWFNDRISDDDAFRHVKKNEDTIYFRFEVHF